MLCMIGDGVGERVTRTPTGDYLPKRKPNDDTLHAKPVTGSQTTVVRRLGDARGSCRLDWSFAS